MARKTNAAVKEATAKTTAAKAAAVKETMAKEVPATASEGKSAEPAKEAKKAPARNIYVKPEESVAYYTVNGQGSDEFKIQL